MGLMDGLSNWLRQIIAVILLASLIDLILPNRTMQRYVRLVAGLFILMTLATPILQWMKGDFTSKLTASLDVVEHSPQRASQQLAMIEEEGAKLRNKHNDQAAQLVSAKLEAAIRSEVEQSEQRGVRKVDIKLERGKDDSLQVAKVVILLEPESARSSSSSVSSSHKEVEPIAEVDIHIEVEQWPKDQETSTGPTSESASESTLEQQSDQAVIADADQEPEKQIDRETRLRVSALIASRFGIATNIVEVKVPAVDVEK